jgi:hypothetical protein
VRGLLAFAVEHMMMELEVEAKTGVPAGARSLDRLNRRNGYRERAWETRVGWIDVAIPELRNGSCFPAFLEPRRTAEGAHGRDPGGLCAWDLNPRRRRSGQGLGRLGSCRGPALLHYRRGVTY